jgi:hypothetical protein
MHYILRQGRKALFFTCFYMLIIFNPIATEASLIDDVTIDTIVGGYEVKINFEFLIRYQRHKPDKTSDIFRIELVPVNLNRLDVMTIASLKVRRELSWDRGTGIPLKDITYEGGDPKHPQMTFIFTREVELDVRGSADLRSLIISVKTNMATQTDGVEEAITEVNKVKLDEEIIGESSVIEKDIEVIVSDKIDVILEKDDDNLMEMAKMAMTEANYRRAVQLYTKILRTAEGEEKKQAQEFIGLARERNDQFAHAKSEYNKYLKDYPEGPDAVRVRQRLAGLVTAAKKPKKRIVEVNKPKKIDEKPKWRMRNYGSYSNFFYRNQILQEGRETRVNRNDLYTNFDLNSRWISEDYDIRFKYTARHQGVFLSDKENHSRMSALSFEVRHKKSDLYGKIGRQTRSSGGVLGRFDGAHISYDISPEIVVNGVFGFPVESTKKTDINTEKKFYGVSADFGTFNEHWDYTAFFITQDNRGMIDRCAIGGEVRYFDPKKSFFTLLDYDVFFNAVNIFLFNGNWTLPSKTTLNLMCDFRRSPLLMANNAIQGQGVEELDDLFGRFTDDELKALAEDRSAVSKSFTFGVTQQINDNIQLTGDFTVSRLEGTVASGGVDALPGAGNEYYCSMQLNINNVLIENDSIINGLRYSDTSRRNTYTYNISARIPFINRKLRIIPKFRMDYREEKGNDDNRLTMNPKMRIDYRLKKMVRLEVEGGVKWADDYSSGISSKSIESFVSAGYRINY